MWLFSLLKSFWKPIAGLLAGLLVLFQRWLIKRQADTIDHQDRVIRGHQAKEKVHEHDQESDANVDTQINDLRERVRDAKTDQEAAGTISDAVNDYFRGGKAD